MAAYRRNPDIIAADQEASGLVDPLKYWHRKQHSFPLLSKLALWALSVPATSVDSEQMFSASGEMSVGKQNRIGKSLLELMVFLYSNAHPSDVTAIKARDVRAVRKQMFLDRTSAAIEGVVRARIAEERSRRSGEGPSQGPSLSLQTAEEDVLDTMGEEQFVEIDVEQEVAPTDPYADIPVCRVDDVLAWEEAVVSLEDVLLSVQRESEAFGEVAV